MKAPTHIRFLEEFDSQIEPHLSDSTLTVKRLLRLVGMSRTDLHRKLEHTVGMSTTEYLRKKRLDRAAELLKEQQDWKISHIASEVGFEHQGYFTRRFKEQFGKCPGAWREDLEHK
jgi:AraC-like DNA-binding protein